MRNKIMLLSVLLLSGCANHYNDLQNSFNQHELKTYLQQDKIDETPKSNNKKSSILQVQQDRQSQKLSNAIRKNVLFPLDSAAWAKFETLSETDKTLQYLNKHYDLNSLLALALVRNASIQRAYQVALAQLQQYSQVQQIDDLLNQYRVFSQDLQLRTSNKKAVMNQLAFPSPDAIALKGKMLEHASQQAQLTLEKTIQSVLTQVRISYFEWHYYQQASGIISEKVDLLQRLSDVSEQVYNTTKGSLDTVLILANDQAKSQSRLASIQNLIQTRLLRLNQLLNIDVHFVPQYRSKNMQNNLRYDKAAGIKTGLQYATDIRLLQSQIDKLAVLIQLAETRIFPDLAFNSSVFNHNPLQKKYFSIQFKPKTNTVFLGNQAYLVEMKQRHKALQSQQINLKNTTTDAINIAYFNYADSRRQQDLYQKTLIPNSQSRFDINQALYETGQQSYRKMMTAYETYLDSRLKQAKMQRDNHIAASRLERLIGQQSIQWITGTAQ
jgi:hypothetical protein